MYIISVCIPELYTLRCIILLGQRLYFILSSANLSFVRWPDPHIRSSDMNAHNYYVTTNNVLLELPKHVDELQKKMSDLNENTPSGMEREKKLTPVPVEELEKGIPAVPENELGEGNCTILK